ncbi:hypothetical protein [Amycolatopsis keratiniphila]|uniref:hypothetical protein n=1 Tax=Amycolatopsis keratiniphila TaxID=129921 RepID=UPI001E366F06|nr:hypothetical protein [Amycolatopsis keratiniphila]
MSALFTLVATAAVPATAAEPTPTTVEQDVDQLYRYATDLMAALPQTASEGLKSLMDAPFPDTTGHRASAASKKCVAGALEAYTDGLFAPLTPLDSKAGASLSYLSGLYARRIASDKTAQVFGTDGQYTARANATIKKLRDFWDIEGRNIQLIAWKGTDAGNKTKMEQTFALGFPPAVARKAAALANKVLFEVPALRGGRDPLLTLNAFSLSAAEPGGKRVVLGDGMLDAFGAIGFDDVSVETALSHEYGHQLDYAHHNSPTDKSKIMGPDAYSGYFVAHPEGGAFDSRSQQEVTHLYSALGVCGSTVLGTSDQRKAASAWGESQADPNRIIPSAEMISKFRQEYPKLVMPPAPTAPRSRGSLR